MIWSHEGPVGTFRLELPGEKEWRASVYEDEDDVFAVGLLPANDEWRLTLQAIRAEKWEVHSVEDLDRVQDGVLLGLQDVMRPLKVLERKSARDARGLVSDVVLRGKSTEGDVMHRRRIVVPKPPAPIFMLTASSPADRFLVHRRTFEEVFDSFTLGKKGKKDK